MVSKGAKLWCPKVLTEDLFMNNCLCNLFGGDNIWWIIIALIVLFVCCGC